MRSRCGQSALELVSHCTNVGRRLPAVVRVLGGELPLSGRVLPARRVYRRYGHLWLVLELPDGGITSVKVEDTDLLGVGSVTTTPGGTTVLSGEGARRLLGLLEACMARIEVDVVADGGAR
jgi:hypothetical protein